MKITSNKTVMYGSLGIALTLVSVFIWFREYIVSLPSLVLGSSDYAYILAVLVSVVAVLALESRRACVEAQDWGFSLGVLSILLSLYAYKAGMGSSIEAQLGMFSVILWVWGCTLILLGLGGAYRLRLPLFSMLLLVPLPRNMLDRLSLALAGYMARAASALTHAQLVGGENSLVLKIHLSGGGVAELVVTQACSGIISLSSTIAIIPLILYVVLRYKLNFIRRILVFLASLTAIALVVLLCNVLRLSLVVWAAQKWGVEKGLALFHTAPSLAYALAAGVIGVFLATRLSRRLELEEGRKALHGESFKAGKNSSRRGMIVAIATLLLLCLAGALLGHHAQTSESLSGNPPLKVDVLLSSSSPLLRFEKAGAITTSVREMKHLEQSIGVPSVYLVTLRLDGKTVTAYVEEGSQATVFHSWPVCLTYQGYHIVGSFTEPIVIRCNASSSTLRANYLLVEKNGLYRLMAYIVLPLRADYGGVEAPLYVKVTLMGEPRLKLEDVREQWVPVARELLTRYAENAMMSIGFYKYTFLGRSGGNEGFVLGLLLAGVLVFNIVALAIRLRGALANKLLLRSSSKISVLKTSLEGKWKTQSKG